MSIKKAGMTLLYGIAKAIPLCPTPYSLRKGIGKSFAIASNEMHNSGRIE
jgi:hypothetical protein